jgi:RNA polymerase sigma factor (sigma-70 family)
VSRNTSRLSDVDWGYVIAARPELHELCVGWARRFPRMLLDDMEAIGEDVLMHMVPSWDPAGDVSLVEYARRRIKRAILRGSAKVAPARAIAAVQAMKAHGASIETLSLSELAELTPAQIVDRAREHGRDAVTVGYSAYVASRVETASSPEELAVAREERERVWSAVDQAGPKVRALYQLCFEDGMTQVEAAAALGTNVPAVKRLHDRGRKQVRAILSRTLR